MCPLCCRHARPQVARHGYALTVVSQCTACTVRRQCELRARRTQDFATPRVPKLQAPQSQLGSQAASVIPALGPPPTFDGAAKRGRMVLEQPSSRGEIQSIMPLVTDLVRPVVAVAVAQLLCTAQRWHMHRSMQIVQVTNVLSQCCVQTAWTWSTSLLPSRLHSLVRLSALVQYAAELDAQVRSVELPNEFESAWVQPGRDRCACCWFSQAIHQHAVQTQTISMLCITSTCALLASVAWLLLLMR